jgi:methylmalonyl-CoA/ethylmalonyl-CoA epimerase
MVIDHIGIVVGRLDDGIEQWRSVFGYEPVTEKVANSRQKVNVVFMAKAGSCMVKLIEPAGDDSPVRAFALKGGGLHHLCFRCDDLASGLERLKSLGLRVIAEPQPGEAFENEKIAFLFARPGLNIELIGTRKKAGLKDPFDVRP